MGILLNLPTIFPSITWNSNCTPHRSSDPGSLNHADYTLSVVHDFRFLDQYAPRLVPPFEARGYNSRGVLIQESKIMHYSEGIVCMV